jgi:AraC family transcriptional regulator, positive regulator of tynA and feaB
VAMETYSTAYRPAGAALGYWNELLERRLFVPVDVTIARHDPLKASLRVGRLGEATIAETVSTPACIEHSSQHVARTATRAFSLLLCLQGNVQLTQYGRQVRLAAGDFALQDSHAPCRISFGETNRSMSLRLTDERLRRFLPAPEDLCAQRMDGSRGLARVVSRMLPGIWLQVAEGLPEEFGEVVAKNLLEMVATCYAVQGPRTTGRSSASKRVRASQIKRMLEERLSERDLSAKKIADSLQISTRYVHRLLAAENETVSEYVLRRRLEEAAGQLRSPVWQGHTTFEIASNWGFGSAAHFSRKFRNRFGQSPTEYRRLRVSLPDARSRIQSKLAL